MITVRSTTGTTFVLVAMLSLGLRGALLGAIRRDTFSDIFKPLPLKYLYDLVDAHPERAAELDTLFEVQKVHNLKRGHHKKVLAFSLFWKSPNLEIRQPEVNQRTVYQRSPSVKGGLSFYQKYGGPLIRRLKTFKKFYPHWIARVYLAKDLSFLIPRLQGPDVEIFVMSTNSMRASPGAMWRFLVFDDPDVSVAYVRDADDAPGRMDGDFSHTNKILNWVHSDDTEGFFRVRDLGLLSRRVITHKRYSPIVASAFGAKKVNWINMKKAMQGYILHRVLFANERRHPKDMPFVGHPFGFGNRFPDYGFDERFLKHVLYFEAIKRGQLTLISTDRMRDRVRNLPRQNWVRLDIEYVRSTSPYKVAVW
jgi:hypothetical protein